MLGLPGRKREKQGHGRDERCEIRVQWGAQVCPKAGNSACHNYSRQFPAIGTEQQMHGSIIELRLLLQVRIEHATDGRGAI